MSEPITEKENQHYVPQFYLKFFSLNDKSVGMYRFAENRFIPHASIKDNFNISFFYGEDGKMEDAFVDLEGKWNTIIKQIIETHKIPNGIEEQLFIRLLFLLQSARTKYKGDEWDDYTTKLYSEILSSKDHELYSKINGKFKIQSKCPAMPYVRAAFDLLPQTYDLTIGLIINESKLEYITSDNPVIYCNHLFESKKLQRGFGFSNIGIQFFLPISPSIMLCMYDSNVYDLVTPRTKHTSKIKKLNAMAVNNSGEAIVFKCDADSEQFIDYITRAAHKKAGVTNQLEVPEDVIVFSNRQLKGNYDLSDFFTIKQPFRNMVIHDPTPEEIQHHSMMKMKEHIKKLEEQGKLDDALNNNDVACISVSIRDNTIIRPWAQRILNEQENDSFQAKQKCTP